MEPKKLLKDPRAFWAIILGLAFAKQIHSLRKHDGGTFSETSRVVGRVDRRWGRLVFLSAWGFLSAWYPVHILEKADQQLREILTDTEKE